MTSQGDPSQIEHGGSGLFERVPDKQIRLARSLQRDADNRFRRTGSDAVLNALPLPILLIGDQGRILEANAAAEAFFGLSLALMQRHTLTDMVPFGSPVLSLIDDVRRRNASVSGHRIDLSLPRTGQDRIADVFAAPSADDAGNVVVMLQEKTIAEKMDRQLTHRGAARSVSAMAATLAHEIKNPLSGIKGAAQLLDSVVSDDDRMLTQLIVDETDRIVKIVDRMDLFADERPLERESVNIHTVLEHVKRLAQSGFARHIRFNEDYDPSLPPVHGNRDHLVQVFLNLVKNAAEAIGEQAIDGEITLSTAYKAGVRIASGNSRTRIGLPLEIGVRDNGSGVPSDLIAHLFDAFVTTKTNGTGLGLALVAKLVGDHGGTIACESMPSRTIFRVLMPMYSARDGRAAEL